ncbi:MAG TPA: GNAT family N-acetyltransferase [Thermoanaerobaculia bacterium]|nr:GNAT family N-acetyltransferase [Thermoanaerobaculia bacterium]
MLHTATSDELPAIRRLLARANDAPYDLEAVAAEKCFGRGIAGEPVVRIFGGYDGIVVTCGKYVRILAVDRERRGRGIGSTLLADAESRGATTMAAEPGNYFTPGVVDSDEATLQFLANRGYRETASTHNLEAPLAGLSASDARRARADERDRVLDFIEREFGRIWRFEAARAFEADPPAIFIVEEAGRIAGFSAHDANNRGLGSFGPTGVEASLRGRGHGRRLLLASLADLARLGYPRAIIPWTDAIEFYERSCGAVVRARFVTMVK